MSDYWSKKLGAPMPRAATSAVPVADAPASRPHAAPLSRADLPLSAVYVAQDRPTGTGYLLLICGFLVLTGLVNRDGTRPFFLLAALAGLIVGAFVLWQADTRALRRIEVLDDELLLVGKKGERRIVLNAVKRIDTTATRLSQFLGWDELAFHTANGVERVRRVDDPGELQWQVEQIAPSVTSDIRTIQRPWIVGTTVGAICATTAIGALGTLFLHGPRVTWRFLAIVATQMTVDLAGQG